MLLGLLPPTCTMAERAQTPMAVRGKRMHAEICGEFECLMVRSFYGIVVPQITTQVNFGEESERPRLPTSLLVCPGMIESLSREVHRVSDPPDVQIGLTQTSDHHRAKHK